MRKIIPCSMGILSSCVPYPNPETNTKFTFYETNPQTYIQQELHNNHICFIKSFKKEDQIVLSSHKEKSSSQLPISPLIHWSSKLPDCMVERLYMVLVQCVNTIQRCISCLTCPHPKLTQDHVTLSSAYVIIF